MAPDSSAEPPPLPCFLQDQRTPTWKRRQTAPALSYLPSLHVIVVSQHLFHSHQLSSIFFFCPLSTGMVWFMGPRPSCAWLQPLGGGPHQTPPPHIPTPSRHTCSPAPFVHLSSLHLSLCLSTHLSSQRILHWSNECANSACCIKCGHPNKLHPLQGIGVAGSKAWARGGYRLVASPVAGQSPRTNHNSQSCCFDFCCSFPPAENKTPFWGDAESSASGTVVASFRSKSIVFLLSG